MVDLHAGAGTVDVSATIPPDWPAFWDNVMSTNADIRVTDAAGVLLTYQITSWNYGNKAGVIEVDGWVSPNVTAGSVLWVYWDNPNGPSSGAGSFSVSSAKTGTIQIGSPGSGSEYVINARPEAAGSDNAQVILAKTPTEIQHIWWNLRPVMMKRRKSGEGSRLLEELETATYTVTHSDGSDTSSAMAIAGDIRALHPAWVRTPIQAGTDTANYVVTLKVTTTENRTLHFHTTIKVRTIDAPTP